MYGKSDTKFFLRKKAFKTSPFGSGSKELFIKYQKVNK